MMGWPQNDDVECFWQVPIEVAAARLAQIIEEERPSHRHYNEIASTVTLITFRPTASRSRRSR